MVSSEFFDKWIEKKQETFTCTKSAIEIIEKVWNMFKVSHSPIGNYMFKVNYRNIRARCKICSNLTLKTRERYHWCLYRSCVFIVNFEQVNVGRESPNIFNTSCKRWFLGVKFRFWFRAIASFCFLYYFNWSYKNQSIDLLFKSID